MLTSAVERKYHSEGETYLSNFLVTLSSLPSTIASSHRLALRSSGFFLLVCHTFCLIADVATTRTRTWSMTSKSLCISHIRTSVNMGRCSEEGTMLLKA